MSLWWFFFPLIPGKPLSLHVAERIQVDWAD